jgi:hypothetical protein
VLFPTKIIQEGKVIDNLIATVEALKSIRQQKWLPEPYPNRRGVWGASVVFWNAGQWHMISVHNCETVIYPSDVIKLIEGINSIDDARWGFYTNQDGVPGFYASARSSAIFNRSADHWVMIARSPERSLAKMLRQKRTLSEDEVDLILYLERARGDARLCA